MKRSKRNDLHQAEMLFAAKKYAQVISLLSPQIFLYRKEAKYHRLLGFACLYTGDFGGAYSYFQRARDISGSDISTLLGLALVMLRRRKTTEALRLWLEVLDLDPDNRQAKKALNMAKILEEEDWLDIIEKRRYSPILPAHPRLIKRLIVRWGVAILVIAAISVAGILVSSRLLNPGDYRIGQELLDFELEDYSQGDYSRFATIILTDRELDAELQTVQRLFRQFRDNLVRYRGNRILLSNAPLDVKDRVALLLGQLSAPDFTDFNDNFSYSDVQQDPALYHGVYVMWRGRVANVITAEDRIQFDLLVGFESGRVVEGRVPVLIDFAAELQGGEAVELIGQLSTRDGSLLIRGSSLRLIRGGEE
jgi:hypothetical protein